MGLIFQKVLLIKDSFKKLSKNFFKIKAKRGILCCQNMSFVLKKG